MDELLHLLGVDPPAVGAMTTRIGIRRIRPNISTRAVLQERELDALASIGWAGILSTSQVLRLHYPSRRKAQRRLRALLDHRLVSASLQGEMLHRDTLWRLTRRGAVMLAESERTAEEIAPGSLPRPAKLAHALAIRDVFVAFCVVERAGLFALEDFRFDDELATAEPFRSARVIPDALALLRQGQALTRVGIEVDRDSQSRRVVEAKLAAWRPLLAGAVGTLFVVTTSERRRDAIAGIATRMGIGECVRVVLLESVLGAIVGAFSGKDAYDHVFRAAIPRL